jgi:putative flippase GtrA
MRLLLQQAAGYGLASLCALGVDMAILWTSIEYLNFPYLEAATVSFLGGACVAYLLSVRLAFQEHRLRSKTHEFAVFVALGTLGLGLNVCIIQMAVRYCGMHVMMAKCVAAACTFTCNFLTRRQLLFVVSRDHFERVVP